MTFNLLGSLRTNKRVARTQNSTFWSALSNLQNDSYAAKVTGGRLSNTIKKDIAIKNAVSILKQARSNFNRYGATESAMAVFNKDNQLAKSLNMTIPRVTSVNAATVGKACSRRINSKLYEAIRYTKQYGASITSQTATLINKTGTLAESQRRVLQLLYNRVAAAIKTINPAAFNRAAICGYPMPVFNARVDALSYILDNLHRCNNVAQCKKLFSKQFAALGWTVNEDGELQEAPEEEVAANAPEDEEVMTPVVDPETDEVVTEDEEETELVDVPEEVEPEEAPATEPQEQPMAIFRWTPNAIKRSTGSLHKLTKQVNNLAKAYNKVALAKKKIDSSVESYNSASEKVPVLNTIESNRRYSTLVGSFLNLYNEASTELVNQAIAMFGVLKDAEVFPASSTAVSVNSITARTPWGLKRSKGFFNKDDIPEGDAEGEEDASGTELPGDLEDDVEGPTKAEDPVESASGPGPTVDSFHYDEDEIPEGDAQGEEDGSGVELPGDLEDDVEGPTEAKEPVADETSDIWTALLSKDYFNEDADVVEETADEGDEVNEEEVDAEEVAEAAEEEEELAEDGGSDLEGDEPVEDTIPEGDSSDDGDEEAASAESMIFFDDDELPDNTAEGETDDSGVELPGDLEDDTEGPTEGDDPVEDDLEQEDTDTPDSDDQGIVEDPANDEATTVTDFLYDYYDEDTLPEGDAEGEEDASGTELPGDLEDDTEGPTEADDPVEDAEGPGPTVEDWWNELPEGDVGGEEEVPEDGDAGDEPVEGDDIAATDPEEELSGDEEVADDDPQTEEGDETPYEARYWNEGDVEEDESGDAPADGEVSDGEAEEADPDEGLDEDAGDDDVDPVDDDDAGDEDAGDDVVSETVDLSYLNEDGDSPAELEDDPVEEVTADPEEDGDAPVEGDEPVEGDDAATPAEDGDAPADGEELVEEIDSDPQEQEYVAEPDATDIFWDEEGDIVGPDTPDEFPTEPTETPDGVDPNAEVDIPDAQTEPYMQPESTPPEDIPSTTIEDVYFE